VAGMTPAELAQARRDLEAFTAGLFEDFTRCDQRARGACYLRGLLLDGRRKSIQPMAAGCPTPTSRHYTISSTPRRGTGDRSAAAWPSGYAE
jgi:DDE superfamily endonuclease